MQATTGGERRGPRLGYVVVSGIMALAVLVQVFLAGGGLFTEPGWWPAHKMLGMTLALGPLALLGLGFAARLPGRTLWLTGLLFVLVGMQPMLINAGGLKPLHVVNALLIFALTALLGQAVGNRPGGRAQAPATERFAR